MSFVTRAEDANMKVGRRLPMHIGLGFGINLGRWLLALDLKGSLAQPEYASVRRADGAGTIQPRDALGRAVGGVIVIGKNDGRTAILNVNMGSQVQLDAKKSVQLGFFTDFSGQPDRLIDPLHPHVNRYGASLGLAFHGTTSVTYVGLVGTLGFGRSYGTTYDPDLDDFKKGRAPFRSQAVYFTLGGSTRLGDPPQKGGGS
jgi:hypothetical protein